MSETYRCLYFLYVWAESDDHAAAPPVWRYRLESASTHEQHIFHRLSALVEFLRAREGTGTEEQRASGS
jgi:hypothetical protein